MSSRKRRQVKTEVGRLRELHKTQNLNNEKNKRNFKMFNECLYI